VIEIPLFSRPEPSPKYNGHEFFFAESPLNYLGILIENPFVEASP